MSLSPARSSGAAAIAVDSFGTNGRGRASVPLPQGRIGESFRGPPRSPGEVRYGAALFDGRGP